MAYRRVPLERWHVAFVAPEYARSEFGSDDSRWKWIEESGYAFAGLWHGQPFACAGIVPQWKGRAIAWSVISKDVSRYNMLWMTRQVLGFFDEVESRLELRRIEITVIEDFMAGHRWAKMLGFKWEGAMECYDPEGNTHIMYARVNNGHS